MVDENTDTSATMRSISWVEDSRATAIAKLQSHLPSLYNTLQLNDLGTWTEFSKSVECENSIPNSIVNKITPFQTVRPLTNSSSVANSSFRTFDERI